MLKKDMKLEDLTQLYTEAETCDKETFAKQRSNILLIAGMHYNKLGSRFQDKIRTNKALDDEQRIRLVMNHTYRIHNKHVNNLMSMAPDVVARAANEKELQDQKAAELHNRVKRYLKRKYRVRERMRKFASSYMGLGECACKIYFDKDKGKKAGYQPVMDENGQPKLDEQGQMIADELQPVYAGGFTVEEIYGYNLLRDPSVKEMEESPFLMNRKLVKCADMKAMYQDDPEKAKMFETTPDKTYRIFDTATQSHKTVRDMCMVMELFIKPSPLYPDGYYYYFTEMGIFEQDVLPEGIFPIVYAEADKIQDYPRGKSPLEQGRPYQIEINRTASKIAEHQITLGDDKIITFGGSTLSQGNVMPGVRGLSVNGPAPTVLAGRAGDQYTGYMQQKITEYYQIMEVDEKDLDDLSNIDPHTLLYKAASRRRKYSMYVEKFEQFQIDFWTLFLDLARKYMPDDELIEAVGKDEAVNIPEFRNPSKICYIFELEAQTEDAESKVGRQIAISQALQYVGSKLEAADLGKLLKQMSFANSEELFSDMTANYDRATNMILALDRGTPQQPRKSDDAPYMIKRLVFRTSQPDYVMVRPEIQQMYEQLIQQYEQIEAMKQQETLAANADLIPTGGGMVKADLYIDDPKNPGTQKRATFPYESLNWMQQRLAQQGTNQARLSQMEQDNQNQVNMMAQQHFNQAQMPQQGLGGQPPMMG